LTAFECQDEAGFEDDYGP